MRIPESEGWTFHFQRQFWPQASGSAALCRMERELGRGSHTCAGVRTAPGAPQVVVRGSQGAVGAERSNERETALHTICYSTKPARSLKLYRHLEDFDAPLIDD
jgi:hypothetical protein